jgi:hypothetical protein
VSLGIPNLLIQRQVDRPTQNVFVPGRGVVFLEADSFTIQLTSSSTFTGSASLTAMTGNGQASASIQDLSGIAEIPASNSVLFSPSVLLSVNGSIRYDYIPIPEPSISVLGMLGALGFLPFRMRKERTGEGRKGAATFREIQWNLLQIT